MPHKKAGKREQNIRRIATLSLQYNSHEIAEITGLKLGTVGSYQALGGVNNHRIKYQDLIRILGKRAMKQRLCDISKETGFSDVTISKRCIEHGLTKEFVNHISINTIWYTVLECETFHEFRYQCRPEYEAACDYGMIDLIKEKFET